MSNPVNYIVLIDSSATNPSTCSIFMLLNYDIVYTLSDMKQWIIDGAKIYN